MSPIRVLILCTGNSARSLIGEALLRDLGGDDFEVHSAGTHPKGVNPLTARVLEEEHLDTSKLQSKSLGIFVGQAFDYVITVCDAAAEECPIFPGNPNRIHWSFIDPAAVEGPELARLAAFRQTSREMRQRISAFVPVARRAAAGVS